MANSFCSFREHYGRWVRFDETSSTHDLLTSAAKSPLLLCSACLIAVRHTTDELASRLAPALLDEAQTLVSRALLTVADSMDFFQSVLILSLWSTTVGQVPLSHRRVASYELCYPAGPRESKVFIP